MAFDLVEADAAAFGNYAESVRCYSRRAYQSLTVKSRHPDLEVNNAQDASCSKLSIKVQNATPGFM
jgi:hypothetical protein